MKTLIIATICFIAFQPIHAADQPAIERVNKSRVKTYTDYFGSQVQKARFIRRGLVGTATVLTAGAIAYSAHSWWNSKSSDKSDTGATPPPIPVPKMDDQEVRRLNMLAQQKAVELECERRTATGMAKQGFMLGVLGGISLGVTSVIIKALQEGQESLVGKIKELWRLDEMLYYAWWKDRLLDQIAIMKDLLTALKSIDKSADQTHYSTQFGPSLFHSLCSELVNSHRLFIYTLERVLGILALKNEYVLPSDKERLMALCDQFSIDLERSIKIDEQKNCITVVDTSLLNAFYQMHDALILVMQSFEARLPGRS